jgi:hypothetical protein
LPFLDFAPIHFISALHGSGVGDLMGAVNHAYAAAMRDMATPELTRVLETAMVQHQPPLIRGRRIKLRYAHQGGKNPPIIVVHGNQVQHVPDAYKRYLANVFRKNFRLEGTPVRVEFRSDENPFKGKRNPLTPRQRRSRKRMLPQSDLWRVPMTGLAPQGNPEQMTFLSNSEMNPQFMREGRVTMTTEKVSDGFYQLAGRRINWDLTDYHPLLAQRKDSLYADMNDLTQTRPSFGYSSATDIREGANGDFLVVASDTQASGASAVNGAGGALAIFNRSVGPFEMGRTDTGYLPSVRFIDAATATGRAGAATSFRHPVSMPDGTIMVSFAANATTA